MICWLKNINVFQQKWKMRQQKKDLIVSCYSSKGFLQCHTQKLIFQVAPVQYIMPSGWHAMWAIPTVGMDTWLYVSAFQPMRS